MSEDNDYTEKLIDEGKLGIEVGDKVVCPGCKGHGWTSSWDEEGAIVVCRAKLCLSCGGKGYQVIEEVFEE